MDINKFIANSSRRKAKESNITETDIENAFCKFAKTKKCKALKLVFLNKRGFPDRTVICPKGRVIFIEFKRKGEKQFPAQILVQKILERFGFEYHVCDEKGQSEYILSEFLEW